MIRMLTVVGARPQFVKAAIISRLVRSPAYRDRYHETFVHTGQHFDASMSAVFFEELGMDEPDHHLSISGGSHGAMTGAMLARIEEIALQARPDLLLIYGDTNSTLAAALAASKQGIPIAHVEAGLRNYIKRMPEEQNRIIVDNLSTWLFCPTQQAITNLVKEGIVNHSQGRPGADAPRVVNVGDIMYDASLRYRDRAFARSAAQRLRARLSIEGKYRLLTLHRAENTDEPHRLAGIIAAINTLDEMQIVFPVHPRTRNRLAEDGLVLGCHVKNVEPVGYLDMIELEADCEMVITDSGGVQKEAFFFRKPCVNMYENSGWVEAVDAGWIVSSGAATDDIVAAVRGFKIPREWTSLYGDGHTGQKILDEISRGLSRT